MSKLLSFNLYIGIALCGLLLGGCQDGLIDGATNAGVSDNVPVAPAAKGGGAVGIDAELGAELLAVAQAVADERGLDALVYGLSLTASTSDLGIPLCGCEGEGCRPEWIGEDLGLAFKEQVGAYLVDRLSRDDVVLAAVAMAPRENVGEVGGLSVTDETGYFNVATPVEIDGVVRPFSSEVEGAMAAALEEWGAEAFNALSGEFHEGEYVLLALNVYTSSYTPSYSSLRKICTYRKTYRLGNTEYEYTECWPLDSSSDEFRRAVLRSLDWLERELGFVTTWDREGFINLYEVSFVEVEELGAEEAERFRQDEVDVWPVGDVLNRFRVGVRGIRGH